MGSLGIITSGILGGATTRVARKATRRAMHKRSGAPRLPRATRGRRGFGAVLAWAAAIGVLLALVDVLREERNASVPDV